MTLEIEKEYDGPIKEDYETIIRTVIEEAVKYESCPYDLKVYVLLTDDEGIHEINKEQRGIDAPTDVLSFPMAQYDEPASFEGLIEDEFSFDPDTGEFLIGDIILNMDRVYSQAKEYEHSPKREMAFLVAHSMLHLFGYDHMEEDEAKIMEAKQKEILDRIGYTRDMI